MSTTIGSVLSERIFSALRSSDVAAHAGVAAATWASTTTPRIFRGIAGFLGGRNRGRLPFVEFDISGIDYSHATLEGGAATTTARIVAHAGGRDPETAGNLLEAILTAGLIAIRDESADNYTALGSDAIGPLTLGPWGHQRETTITVVHSYGRSDYEVGQ